MPETEIIIPGGRAAAVRVSTGQFIEITDVAGGQVAEPVVFAIERHHEWLSITHTRSVTLRLNLQVGDVLVSNWRRPMYQIVHDDVGVGQPELIMRPHHQRARRQARRIDTRAPRRPIQLSKNARTQAPADGRSGH